MNSNLLRDIAASGVEHDDPRLDYVIVQIDRATWDELQRAVLHVPPNRRACECDEPDPVMYVNRKFYCYQCSFETGAREMSKPERRVGAHSPAMCGGPNVCSWCAGEDQ
jgi:hypothetical protein